ncbi:MAG: hypothetical protein AAGF96_05940 [Bacteroidota bacterium]
MKLIIPTRSPYYFNISVDQFTQSVTWEITTKRKTASGTENIQEESITKQVPSQDFTQMWADVSPIIRDFYHHIPIELSDLQAGGIIRSRNDEVLRVDITVSKTVTAGPSTSGSSTFDCLDGYSLFEEGQNTRTNKDILLEHDSYKMAEDGYFIVPLWVLSGSSDPTINGTPVALLSLDSPLDALQYLIIRGSDYSGDVTVAFGNDSILIEREVACKYPVYDVQFINRFGVIESMEFRAVAKKSMNITKSSFLNSFTDGTSYNTRRHQKREYLISGMNKITLESDYLNENYNKTIEQLMLSEKVWLRQGSNINPVNVSSNSLAFKTRVVDKLISYNLEFGFAHEIMNTV